MARKFKIGDKVKIVHNYGVDFEKGFRKGQAVVVSDYYSGFEYPYVTKNRKNIECAFMPQELELVERKSNG